METVLRLVLVAVLLLVGCSSPPPPSITPPTWTKQPAPTLPRERLHSVHGAVGWSGGFVVAGNYVKLSGTPGQPNETPAVLHMSADGRTWRQVTPPDIGAFAWGQAAAAHGDRAYVVGHNGAQPVLLTSEGGVWTKIDLPGGVFTDNPVSITAGPRGVVVVGFYRKGNQSAKGLRIWHSADGKQFGEPVELTKAALYSSYLPEVITTGRGFLIHGAVPYKGRPQRRDELLFESADGRDWQPVGGELPDPPEGRHHGRITAAEHNNGMTVLFGSLDNADNPEDSDAGLTGWYRRDGESSWTKLADIDPGRLPDAGVVPKPQRRVDQVVKWQTGFLAIGSAQADAAVWTSADGLTWTKMPVRDNGFEKVSLAGFLSDGGLDVLLGQSDGAATAELWHTGSPSARPATNHPVPKGGTWQGILGTSAALDDTGGGEIKYSDFKVTDAKQFVVRFRHVGITAGGTRTVEVTSSDDPAVPAGGTLSAKVEANGVTVLFPDGTQREFCGTGRYDECS